MTIKTETLRKYETFHMEDWAGITVAVCVFCGKVLDYMEGLEDYEMCQCPCHDPMHEDHRHQT